MCVVFNFIVMFLYLQKSELKILGQYTAMSIVQGGPGFPVLHANVYNYIVTGKYIGVHTPDEDVANPTVVALL